MAESCMGPLCDARPRARGLCVGHWEQDKKGEPPRVILRGENRIWGRVEVTGFCWLWTGYINASGYGRTQHDGRLQLAHRVAYELLVGPVPDGMQLDHLCRVRRCVNPDHLEPVTSRENTRRGKAVKTHCPRGHALVDGNLVLSHLRRGWRSCLTCHREGAREQWRQGRHTSQRKGERDVR